jgi:hypothetical protein
VTSLQPHVDRHAILAFEKQMHAYDVVGDRGWEVDFDTATIAFDDGLDMRMEILGTEHENVWLWGWADEEGFPDPVIRAGRALAEYGREHDLPALHLPESLVDEDVSLDRIGIVASGVLELKATYHAPLDGGGRVLFALDHPSLALPPTPDRERLLAIVKASGFVHDWEAAVAAYDGSRT